MKRIGIFLIALLVFITLCACGPTMQTEQDVSKDDTSKYSMFIQLENNTEIGYRIVYHRDTKVMYSISDGYYNHGTFTVLLNADGTPMTYEKDTEGER